MVTSEVRVVPVLEILTSNSQHGLWHPVFDFRCLTSTLNLITSSSHNTVITYHFKGQTDKRVFTYSQQPCRLSTKTIYKGGGKANKGKNLPTAKPFLATTQLQHSRQPEYSHR